jgi:hypothetical protein
MPLDRAPLAALAYTPPYLLRPPLPHGVADLRPPEARRPRTTAADTLPAWARELAQRWSTAGVHGIVRTQPATPSFRR